MHSLLYLVLLLTSCSLLELSDSSEDYKAKFSISAPNSGEWSKIKLENTDVAFENVKTFATFYVYSFCDKTYNLSLEQTQKNILKDFKQLTTMKMRTIQMVNREALTSEFTGLIDGIKVSGILTSLQKDHCQFDFVMIESRQNNLSDTSKNDFYEFLKGFNF